MFGEILQRLDQWLRGFTVPTRGNESDSNKRRKLARRKSLLGSHSLACLSPALSSAPTSGSSAAWGDSEASEQSQHNRNDASISESWSLGTTTSTNEEIVPPGAVLLDGVVKLEERRSRKRRRSECSPVEPSADWPQSDRGHEPRSRDSTPQAEPIQPHPEIATHDEAKRMSLHECIFHGEVQEDYTVKRAQMLSVHDGVRDCVALLLTYELSFSIQAAAKANRELGRTERWAHSMSAKAGEYRHCVAQEAGRQDSLFQALQPDSAEYNQSRQEIQSVLARLEHMQTQLEDQETMVDHTLRHAHHEFDEAQKKMMSLLDTVFVRCKLLDPGESVAEYSVSGLEYEHDFSRSDVVGLAHLDADCSPSNIGRAEAGRSFPAGGPTAAYETARYGSSSSPVYRARRGMLEAYPELDSPPRSSDRHSTASDTYRALYRAFAFKADALEKAERLFEDKSYVEHLEAGEAQRAVERGDQPEDANVEAFDLRHLKRSQRLTRELIDAEEKYKQAKIAARDAGVDLCAHFNDGRLSSIFADEVDDDCDRHSEGRSAYYHINDHMVETWLSNLPHGFSSTGLTIGDGSSAASYEVDSASVEIWESLSQCNRYDGGVSTKIKAWHDACEASRERCTFETFPGPIYSPDIVKL